MGREGNLRPLVDLVTVPELMVVNETQTLRVFAPFTACEGESPTFSAELFDADNMPVEVDGQLTLKGNLVEFSAPYVPKNAGLHFLRVSFEPNMGARAVSLLVAGAVDVNEGTHVKLPMAVTECVGAWPLGSDAVVCEGSNEVSVFFADGGLARFDGTEVATAGNVLWSVEGSALERRVLDGGALIRTNTWPDVSTAYLAGEHTETSALRPGVDGDLKFLRHDRPVSETIVAASTQPPPVFYVSTEYGYDAFGPGGCGSCGVPTLPIAFEHGFAWRFEGEFAPGFLRASRVTMFGEPAASLPTLLPRRRVEVAVADGPFEVMPLWAGPVLVSMRGGTVSATVWPRERVLRVASNFVVVQEPDALSVRLVPR